MLGETIISHLKETPSRSSPRLRSFIEQLQFRKKEILERSPSVVPVVGGVRLLYDVLKLFSIHSWMNSSLTPLQMAYEALEELPFVESLVVSQINTGRRSNLFVRSKDMCFELIVPSNRKNPLTEIPFDMVYTASKWDDVKPLRIVDMGMADLSFNVREGYISYTRKSPIFAMYTIDCFALVMKFLAYYPTIEKKLDLNDAVLLFVEKHVVLPTLMDDAIALWMRNTCRRQFISDTLLENRTSTMWDNITVDSFGTEYNAAMEDVLRLKTECLGSNITPLDVLSSIPMGLDRVNFISYYKTLYNTTNVSERHPLLWAQVLKNINWWEFILIVFTMGKNFPSSKAFERTVLRDVKLALMTRPWNKVGGSLPYRNIVQSRLEGMADYLRNV